MSSAAAFIVELSANDDPTPTSLRSDNGGGGGSKASKDALGAKPKKKWMSRSMREFGSSGSGNGSGTSLGGGGAGGGGAIDDPKPKKWLSFRDKPRQQQQPQQPSRVNGGGPGKKNGTAGGKQHQSRLKRMTNINAAVSPMMKVFSPKRLPRRGSLNGQQQSDKKKRKTAAENANRGTRASTDITSSSSSFRAQYAFSDEWNGEGTRPFHPGTAGVPPSRTTRASPSSADAPPSILRTASGEMRRRTRVSSDEEEVGRDNNHNHNNNNNRHHQKQRKSVTFWVDNCLTGRTRHAFMAFFLFNIFVTLTFDSQAILPPWLVSPFGRNVVRWYSEQFNDRMYAGPPFDNVLLKSIATFELIFHLPFFLVALYALTSGRVDGSGWFRVACIAYGTHRTTSLIPVLTSIATDALTTWGQKMVLFTLYSPHLVFPIWLALLAGQNEDVFYSSPRRRFVVYPESSLVYRIRTHPKIREGIYQLDEWLEHHPRISQYKQLERIEEWTGISKMYLVFAVLANLSFVVCNVVGTEYLADLACFLYPGYASYKAIDSGCRRDRERWLTYWIVVGGAVAMFDNVIAKLAFWWSPLYNLKKACFYVWLYHPSYNGADFLYWRVARPLLLPGAPEPERAPEVQEGEEEMSVQLEGLFEWQPSSGGGGDSPSYSDRGGAVLKGATGGRHREDDGSMTASVTQEEKKEQTESTAALVYQVTEEEEEEEGASAISPELQRASDMYINYDINPQIPPAHTVTASMDDSVLTEMTDSCAAGGATSEHQVTAGAAAGTTSGSKIPVNVRYSVEKLRYEVVPSQETEFAAAGTSGGDISAPKTRRTSRHLSFEVPRKTYQYNSEKGCYEVAAPKNNNEFVTNRAILGSSGDGEQQQNEEDKFYTPQASSNENFDFSNINNVKGTMKDEDEDELVDYEDINGVDEKADECNVTCDVQ